MKHHRLAQLKDVWGGALTIAIGAGVVLQTAWSYPIGTLQSMGPGYFPLALGIILVATGIFIAGKACVTTPDRSGTPAPEAGAHAPQWRAWALISLSIGAFVAGADYLGLVPAAFAVVFIAAIGDRGNTRKSAALLALGVVAVAVTVFWWGLQVQLPLFRWPLR